MIKALVLSGDKATISEVSRALTDFCPRVSCFGVADNIQAGVQLINTVQPDILILDTKLADGSGFELLKHFNPISFKVIFLSVHIEYSLKAFKFNAVDFLLKPPDSEELSFAVNKACDLIHKEKIILKTFDHIHIVNLDEIVHVEADRNYSTFHITDGRKIIVSRSIKDFEDQLNNKGFYRIHKSHIINIRMVKYFDKEEGGYVVMKDGVSVPVASRKRELLLELFDNLAG